MTMQDKLQDKGPSAALPPNVVPPDVIPLGAAPLGFRGRIEAIEVANDASGLPPQELESRLIELGFLEGARVEILHEGLIARDPIAVRVNHSTVALRRREAMAILVLSEDAAR